MESINNILTKGYLTQEDIILLLECREEEGALFARSKEIRNQTIGNGVSQRGLIEISNICRKDCLYCGIRRSNKTAFRYELNDGQILEAAHTAWELGYGSIVMQGGERNDPAFARRITRLLQQIKQASNNELGITLSLGEQTEETYRRWFEAGAHRYLLRIETSNEELYHKIHPRDEDHSFRNRLECLDRLQRCGYQTGTGVMIGLPFQTTADLANDLLFLKSIDADMVGMGPYLEHPDTPLAQCGGGLISRDERLRLSLHMISCLRLLMPDINIAATTALQAITPKGREKALEIGANVIMPNVTPKDNRGDYRLYDEKPGMDEGAEESARKLAENIRNSGCEIRFNKWGDSVHFRQKKESHDRGQH